MGFRSPAALNNHLICVKIEVPAKLSLLWVSRQWYWPINSDQPEKEKAPLALAQLQPYYSAVNPTATINSINLDPTVSNTDAWKAENDTFSLH